MFLVATATNRYTQKGHFLELKAFFLLINLCIFEMYSKAFFLKGREVPSALMYFLIFFYSLKKISLKDYD